MENYEQSLNTSQEKDFQIIESYCLLSGQNKMITKKSDMDKIIEKKKIQELHNHVQKILDEFN